MLGETINEYTIESFHKSGGIADVYEAKNAKNKKAAIKILKPRFKKDPAINLRFANEADAMIKLKGTGVAPTILSTGWQGGNAAIIMDFLEGETLKEKLIKEEYLSEEDLQKWFLQIVEGLEIAHSKGIIHRDIKPSNLFITKEGQVIIIDFGIAKVAESASATITGQILGTIMYMSPEQIVKIKLN